MKSKVLGFKWAVVAVSLLLLLGVLAGFSVGRIGGKKAEAMTAAPSLTSGSVVYDYNFVQSVIALSSDDTKHTIHIADSCYRDGMFYHSRSVDCYAVNDIPGNNELLRCDNDKSLITDNAVASFEPCYPASALMGMVSRHVNASPAFETVSSEFYRLTGVSLVVAYDTADKRDPYRYVGDETFVCNLVNAFSVRSVYGEGYCFDVYPTSLCYDVNHVPGYSLVFVYHYELTVEPIPLPEEPSKEGHTFAGWYYGTDEDHGDGEACVPYDGLPILEETDFHAHWNIDRHTVTYETGENGSEVSPITVDWGTVLTGEQIAAPTRIGYNFLGWFMDDDIQYTNQPIKDDTTLTAHWEIKKFTVTFYVDGEEYHKETVEYGTRLIDVLKTVGLANYAISTPSGVRLSKDSTVVTDDISVEATELSGIEKFGDWVGYNPWFVWTVVGVGCFLVCLAAVGIATIFRR